MYTYHRSAWNPEKPKRASDPMELVQLLPTPNAATLEYSFSCCSDPTHKIIFSALLPNCDFATVKNCNVNIRRATLVKGSFDQLLRVENPTG